MDKTIATIDDLELENRKVLLRIDINSPIGKNGEILDDTRFKAHIGTIRELIERKTSIIILAHQGRPFSTDYTRLKKHAELLSNLLGEEVAYVPDVIGPHAKQVISELKPGEIVLLDNTRLHAEDAIEASLDDQASTILAKELSKQADFYVNDAFAVSHRRQATVIGIPQLIPAAAGRLLEKEIRVLTRAISTDEKPKVFVLGGAKLKDTVRIIEYLIKSGAADEILTTGLVGLLFLMVSGRDVGKATKAIEKKTDEKTMSLARKLIAENVNIRVPLDFISETNEGLDIVPANRIIGAPMDIGPSTIEYYTYKMRRAKIIVMRGPAGVIEDPRFRRGTKELVEYALTRTSAFTIFGGGHFNAILSALPEDAKRRIGHISTGGGALLYFLSGRILPGLEALSISFEKFFNR
ncbi:MAG: phosphoglycerate kinase [Desulfurococcales archaeon]|nr:phosphoglycerate kinase [Desulfurococcales archaeon]MEB3789234.1 phosphoglycerate kinase [Desulfurococcales archaeon]